ncbi:hypothetical protein BJV77DRAFT_680707 [Russula vinacea]|nr:hypothetical protein BJV77DRAFT_680707 [Russula vinacea]
MTGAEALRAIHDVSNKVGDNTDKMRDALQAVHDKVGGVEGMLQGVTEMLQGVSDKVQGVDDREKDISDKVINGVEETGRRTENHFDTMTEEGLEGVRDRPVEVDKVPSAVKDIGSRSISGEGLEKMTPPAPRNSNSDQSRQKCTEWLSPPDPSVNYNTARDTQHRGTAAWFIESNTFREWEKTGCLLWIRGKPGSGKSVLTHQLCDHPGY